MLNQLRLAVCLQLANDQIWCDQRSEWIAFLQHLAGLGMLKHKNESKLSQHQALACSQHQQDVLWLMLQIGCWCQLIIVVPSSQLSSASNINWCFCGDVLGTVAHRKPMKQWISMASNQRFAISVTTVVWTAEQWQHAPASFQRQMMTRLNAGFLVPLR